MNYRLTVGGLGLALALVGLPAQAESLEDVRSLLSTGDCPGCDLSGISLNGLALQEADLQGADLSGSQLQNIDLTRANLTGADLSDVYFSGTNLTGANLQEADLSGVNSAFVCSSSFYGYSDENPESCVTELLTFQVLGELCAEAPEVAEMVATTLGDASDICGEEGLMNIALYTAYSSYQSFLKPLQLRGANLSSANLKDADFSGADLSYATLADADATGANLDYTRLFYADTTGLLNADTSNAWDNWESLGEWIIAAQAREQEQAQRAAGKTYIGAMGRAQQAYYLEYERFTTELSELGIGISEEEEEFRFGIMASDVSDRIVQYALNKTGEYPSFIGVVTVEMDAEAGYATTTSTICESESTEAIAVADLPAIEAPDGFFNCPEGWKLIE